MKQQKKERRSYVRGNFSYNVQFKVIPMGESERECSQMPPIPYQDKLRLKIEQEATDNSDVTAPMLAGMIDFLVQMDEKLDRILDLVFEKEDTPDLFNHGVGADISASGMRIFSNKYVEPKQKIHAKIMLSRLPLVRLEIIGEVVQVIPAAEDSDLRYHIGIKFLDLDDDDKEKIIKCVFQKERASIRKRKSKEHRGKAIEA